MAHAVFCTVGAAGAAVQVQNGFSEVGGDGIVDGGEGRLYGDGEHTGYLIGWVVDGSTSLAGVGQLEVEAVECVVLSLHNAVGAMEGFEGGGTSAALGVGKAFGEPERGFLGCSGYGLLVCETQGCV